MRAVWVGAVAVLAACVALTLGQQTAGPAWISAGASGALPAQAEFPTPTGRVGLLLSGGPVELTGHPFCTPLGKNGRACVTCHQPAYGMSFSAEAARDLWKRTGGKDPLFATVDGSNCPNLPQEQEKSHSLLLQRGLIRVFLPVPKNAEFAINVVGDPTGCNTSPHLRTEQSDTYRLRLSTATHAANLKYVTGPAPRIVLKLGALADTDPATGRPVGMNFMADAREATLLTQARSAALGHGEAESAITFFANSGGVMNDE